MHDFIFRACRRMAPSVRRLAFCGVVALAIQHTSNSMLEAAPVTLAFEAEVSSVSETPGVDFSLDVNEGDRLTGIFTFEPEFLPPPDNPLVTQEFMVSQPFAALFEIDGNTFRTPVSTESLRLAAANNANIRVITVVDGSTHEETRVEDRVEIDGSLISQDSEAFPGLAAPSHFSMELWGNQSAFEAAGFSSDITVWNAFDLRRSLLISLVDNSGESLVIRAAIGEMSVVPEPASLTLLLVCPLLAALTRRKSFR